jgi:hypothetical protein
VNCAVFSSCFYVGSVKRLSAFVGLDLLRALDEELFGVYGELYPHGAARVAPFQDAHRLAYAFGLHCHPEGAVPFVYFQGNLYHPSPPSRRVLLLCTSARPETAVRRAFWRGGLGKAAFGVVRGERNRRLVPSSSMAHRRRGRQQVNECCSVYAPTTISQTSMLRIRRVAIGLLDYSQPVMVARTIALQRSPKLCSGLCSTHSYGYRVDPDTVGPASPSHGFEVRGSQVQRHPSDRQAYALRLGATFVGVVLFASVNA